jgi:ubiquinone/menaquinone biosynthesis C-methylase UbiE
MEGAVAKWYTRTRSKDMEDFRREAKGFAEGLTCGTLLHGARVLEVAPGPGFFSIELAKLGKYTITGLDISRTLVAIATGNARDAGVKVDFQWGNAAAMPFADHSFDRIYCSAAFKNFSEPVKALDEMHRVLRTGGEAVIADLRKDATLLDIDNYVRESGRNWIDGWVTRWTFRHVLLKRAYTQEAFEQMAKQSRFGACQISVDTVGLRVRLQKPAETALVAS